MKLKFKQASIEDFGSLIHLVNEFDQALYVEKRQPYDLKKERTRNRKYLKKYLQDPNCIYILCEKENQLIGYSFLSIEKHKKELAYINELFVIASERGYKVGLALLEQSLQWLKAKNCQQINLTVNRNNTVATKLYTQLGFQVNPNDYIDMSLTL